MSNHVRAMPLVQDDTLVYQKDGQDYWLCVETPAWNVWLSTATTFAFRNEIGTFTARREQSGNKRGGWYWRAYRKRGGKLRSVYVGTSEGLTLARLNAVAQELAELAVGDAQATDHEEAPPASQPANPFTSLLATKLHVPRVRTPLVPRSHLVERLQRGAKRQLTLISAPAGLGKTTVLAQWVAESSSVPDRLSVIFTVPFG